ncbi:MAG: cell wall hydrolase [Robiginitomaculum sp.]|nr:cell wall hydrolase [Robiginitomaculum sp.]MDQ7077128.1 cell wall hydrolase [Robiginitomaculum sp.]
MAKLRSYRQSKWRALLRPETGLAALAVSLTLALPMVLSLTAERGAEQLDNTSWKAFAQEFLQEEPVVVNAGPVSTDAQAYAQVFVVDGKKAAMQQDLQIMASLETFTKTHIEKAAAQEKALNCMAMAIYYEARSETLSGQLAVAQVVLNRVKHRAYPDNVCDVVFEGSNRNTGCQFTFTCDGSMAILPRQAGWNRSRKAAIHAMLGMSDVTIGRATHYHTVEVQPYWSSNLLRTANIGMHVFYRFPSRREKALLLDAAYKS